MKEILECCMCGKPCQLEAGWPKPDKMWCSPRCRQVERDITETMERRFHHQIKAEREKILKMCEEIDEEMENAEEVSAEAYNDGVAVFLRLLKQRLEPK